jgi:hypothetical protein
MFFEEILEKRTKEFINKNRKGKKGQENFPQGTTSGYRKHLK